MSTPFERAHLRILESHALPVRTHQHRVQFGAMGEKGHVTQEKKRQARAMRRSGATRREIHLATGLSLKTIAQVCGERK